MMKTTIIPQIKQITAFDTPLVLSSFSLSQSVLDNFPRAKEIFADNRIGGENPIRYVVEQMPEEAYRIRARNGCIDVLASSSKGLMYGLFTLSELDFINDGQICEFDVYDEQSLPLRALSDDISRGQISTLSNFYAVIRRLARYKYNTYMPYVEDVFRFSSVPAWGRYSEPLDKEEWRAIIAYAREWNLSVRPIVNLLGHFDKLCHIRDLQHLCLRRRDGSLTDCMDPTKPEVRETIRKMLAEIVDCFGKGVIHCGGDEPLGLTQVFGVEEGGRLFIEHYAFIHDELEKLGCTLMMYADFFAPPWGDYAVPVDRARELPEGTEFVFWDYAAREAYPFVDALHRQNIKMYMSPGTWTWKRFACDIRQCYDNTMGLLKADNGRSKGMIMSSWADGGDTLRELTAPGVLIGANFCWNPSSSYSYDDVYLLIHKSLYGFDEEQALLLDPVYHHDRIVKRADEHEFKLEMWQNPFDMVQFKDRENIAILQAAMRKAEADYASLTPARNQDAFRALSLSIARARFTADKIALLPDKAPENMEEALPFADHALALAGQLLAVKELHRKLWFDTNRHSDWEICAARYDDLYDQLRMFARNVRLRKYWFRH